MVSTLRNYSKMYGLISSQENRDVASVCSVWVIFSHRFWRSLSLWSTQCRMRNVRGERQRENIIILLENMCTESFRWKLTQRLLDGTRCNFHIRRMQLWVSLKLWQPHHHPQICTLYVLVYAVNYLTNAWRSDCIEMRCRDVRDDKVISN